MDDYIIINESDGKLFRQIRKAMNHVDGSLNYFINNLSISIYLEGIEVEGRCANEYGGIYGNNDRQFIRKDALSSFVSRKIYGIA